MPMQHIGYGELPDRNGRIYRPDQRLLLDQIRQNVDDILGEYINQKMPTTGSHEHDNLVRILTEQIRQLSPGAQFHVTAAINHSDPTQIDVDVRFRGRATRADRSPDLGVHASARINRVKVKDVIHTKFSIQT